MEKICSGLKNGGIRRLQIREGFRDYKSGQKRLQIGEVYGFQIEVKRLQIGAKRFQIGAREISNRSRDLKSGQGLQIDPEQQALRRVL